MALKDLSGKSVYELDREDFDKLFCRQCKDCGRCVKDPKTINICRGLIDSGVWDMVFRQRVDCQLIKCRYCDTEFPRKGDGLQVCPGCGSNLLC